MSWQMSRGRDTITVSVLEYYNIGDKQETVVCCVICLQLSRTSRFTNLDSFESTDHVTNAEVKQLSFSKLIGVAKILVMFTKPV